jgi:eukaryotic-like serine/threonine-protein kinase
MDLPTEIGRYTIVRELGLGGMGRVLLARDSVLGRDVAIKILRDDLGIPPETREQLFARMKNEARAAAAISHPHLVTLFDMGEQDSVGLYLVFEYIEGPTLRERIGRGTLPASEVARLARELGGALTRAHEAGVIHRDVKPENIMLSIDGAKITDFGIARLPDSKLTRAGAVLGTPAYSAPEALASSEFSSRSDQFSLATTFYEALSGKRAFPGDDAMSVATRVATEDATPIGAFANVDEVLARAMSKDKDKRFASCAIFGDALAAALELRAGAPPASASLRISMTSTSRVDTPFHHRSSLVPKQTRRWQNLLAASAVLLIIGLVVIGRRQRNVDPGVSMRDLAAEFALVLESRANPPPASSHVARPPEPRASEPHPRPSSSPSTLPSASAAPSASASAAPPSSAPSASVQAPSPSAPRADSGAP